jgi:hypothetical protein
MTLRLAKIKTIEYCRHLLGEEPLRVYKNFPVCLHFFIVKCKKAASRKISRKCIVFASSRREMLLRAIRYLLGLLKGCRKFPKATG